MSIRNFGNDVLGPYERNLPLFFDSETGAVIEPGREDGTPAFLFTEVTGYAILDRLLLHSLTLRQGHMDAARRAADWIIAKGMDSTGGALTRFFFDHDDRPELADKSFAGRRIYSFDTAICLRGLVAIYKATKHEPYLEAAVRMGRYLVDVASNDDGEVVAIYDAKAAEAVPPNREVWSRCFGAFLSKTGEALIELHSVTDDEQFAERAKAICHAALRFQGAHGSFETSMNRCELHPHCYATEGLLHVGRMSGDARFVDAAKQATEWALDQLADGGIPQVVDFETNAAKAKFRTDALAQVLALGCDLRQMGILPARYFERLDTLAQTVLSMREGQQGFFRYGFYEREFRGRLEAATHSYWTQMFCLRGLEKYYVSSILDRTFVAVLAGGIGSRVWPLSCEAQPKHLSYAFLGERSLLQETIKRYTDGHFISPKRVLVLCRGSAFEQMAEQAGQLGVPRTNMVIELEPKGTIPASMLALDACKGISSDLDRIVIVSMADNAVTPYHCFQDAVKAALIAAAENDCLISVGRPLAKGTALDNRLGHMRYTGAISGTRVHRVEQFVEKPNQGQYDEIRSQPGKLATESGAVIFRESYFRAVAQPGPGNLAEHLLSKAVPWSQEGGAGVQVATTLLPDDIRFEDFGVPGSKLRAYHTGNPRFDLGNGNICIGTRSQLQTLLCSNTLVIADKLPIRLYGLSDVVVIDSAVTNTSVIMPIEDVEHLPHLFRLFQGSQGYESFITGGPAAQTALPTAFVERCPHTVAEPSLGLVFAYNIPGKISISRSQDGLVISNLELPELSVSDFDVLVRKQAEDQPLVEHVLHVGALAKALLGGDVVLSAGGRDILHKLCLYHALGGQLTPAKEELESRIANRVAHLTKLDRRLLDTRIVMELLRQEGTGCAAEASTADLINHYISSAIAFLQNSQNLDRDLRDVVTLLIQVQDSPQMFVASCRNFVDSGLMGERDEIASVFACFKAAQNFVNGRWHWKRTRKLLSSCHTPGFLRADRGPIEDYPFVLAFTIDWLQQAGIRSRPLVTRLNELIGCEKNDFCHLLRQLDGGAKPLCVDRIYKYLLTQPRPDAGELGNIMESALSIEPGANHAYQLMQILDLPVNLKKIAACCPQITQSSVEVTTDAILSFYHKHWRDVTRYIEPNLITDLLRSRPAVSPVTPQLILH